MIRRYLKFKLGLNYKIVRTISCNHNFIVNKLKRQCAASNYIDFLYEGKRIINIDESNIADTDSRNRGWWYPRRKNQVTKNHRMSNVNLILGISSYGEFFYSVNFGKTNSDTFFLYIMKLVQKLQS